MTRDTRHALLSFFGTLLCRAADGTLVQRPIAAGGAVEASTLATRPVAGTRLVSVVQDGMLLRADPDGQHVTFDREVASAHEHFLPIPEADLTQLRHLLEGTWLARRADAAPQPVACTLGHGFELLVGTERFALPAQLPLSGPALPLRVSLLAEGWSHVTLCRFRPLVLYTAFADGAVLSQLAVSLRSLVTHGAYDGGILILSDFTQGDIERIAGTLAPARLEVIPFLPADKVGFHCARYALPMVPGAAEFQPILYADADNVFDLPVAPMLHEIACATRIMAAAEDFAPRATMESVGARMIDPAQAGTTLGFNSGLLGIPNLVEHADTLGLVARLAANRCDVFGRQHSRWIDQPIANYVDAARGGFETAAMTRRVRWGYEGVCADRASRRGVVHFWPPRPGEGKDEAMRDYLRKLDG